MFPPRGSVGRMARPSPSRLYHTPPKKPFPNPERVPSAAVPRTGLSPAGTNLDFSRMSSVSLVIDDEVLDFFKPKPKCAATGRQATPPCVNTWRHKRSRPAGGPTRPALARSAQEDSAEKKLPLPFAGEGASFGARAGPQLAYARLWGLFVNSASCKETAASVKNRFTWGHEHGLSIKGVGSASASSK